MAPDLAVAQQHHVLELVDVYKRQPLIQQMGKALGEGRQVFASFTQGLESKRIKILMRVNGIEVNPGSPDSWPSAWTRLELALRTPPMVIEENDTALQERLLLELIIPFFGMMAALIGVLSLIHI